MRRSINSSDQGLLSILRLFVGIRLIFSVLAYIAFRWFGPRAEVGQPFPWVSIGESALLLGFLSWVWLGQRLGRFYLPIALGVATLGPVLENFVNIQAQLNNEVTQQRAFTGQWQVVILLVVPVILIAWRYGFRILALYLAFLTAVDGGLIFLVIDRLELRPWPSVTILVFRTLVYLLVGYVVSWLANEQRQQNARLVQANRQLSAAASTLEQLTISRERNRLARELHDTLAHSLSAVAVQLEAVDALWESDPQKAHAMLDRSLEMTRGGLGEARHAIHSLRTAPVVDLGLALAMRNLANSEAERGGYTVDVQAPDDLPRFSPEVEHGLYRIVEEALRNTTRHAGAKAVRVDLEQHDHHLEMTIRDDGCGFDNSSAIQADHYGLRGIRERAEAIGAALTIDSRPGRGTTIRVDLETGHDPGIDA
jgi:signal transduction histidine kinase